jgi:hypothetical protein
MAGLRSNSAWWAIQKQLAQGTAAAGTAASAFKIPFAGGSIGPVRETDRLAETDSSVDQGDPYVTASGVEGSPEAYVRDSYLPLLLHGVLNGAIVSSGTTNFTHQIDAAANDMPYYTIWKDIGAQSATTPFAALAPGIMEKFVDCRIGSATISAEAGSPLTIAAGIQGRIPTNEDAPASIAGLAMSQDPVYLYSHATDYAANPDVSLIKLNNGATFKIRSFELTIENNVSRQQTNTVYPLDVPAGVREVTLGFDLVFDDNSMYEQYHYAGGVDATTNIYTLGSTIAAPGAQFIFRRGTNNEVSFTLPKIAVEEFPVEPDPGGDPIVVPVRGVALRGTATDPIVRATVKNQNAGTAYAGA